MLGLEEGPHHHFLDLGDSSQLAEGHHAHKLTFLVSGLAKFEKAGAEDRLEATQEVKHDFKGLHRKSNRK